MPISIYTNRASHMPTYLPTEQAIPFTAYATLGAQQQARQDKYADELLKMTPELNSLEKDSPFAQQYHQSFYDKLHQGISDINTGDVTKGVSALQELHKLKNLTKIPGTEQYAVNDRFTKFTEQQKAAAPTYKGYEDLFQYKVGKAKYRTPELGYDPNTKTWNPVEDIEVVKPMTDQEEIANALTSVKMVGEGILSEGSISNITKLIEGGASGAVIFEELQNLSGATPEKIKEVLRSTMLDPNSDILQSRTQKVEKRLFDQYIKEGMDQGEAYYYAELNAKGEAATELENDLNGIARGAAWNKQQRNWNIQTPKEGSGSGSGLEAGDIGIEENENSTAFIEIANNYEDLTTSIKTKQGELEAAKNSGNLEQAASIEADLNDKINLKRAIMDAYLNGEGNTSTKDYKGLEAANFLDSPLSPQFTDSQEGAQEFTFQENIQNGIVLDSPSQQLENKIFNLINQYNEKENKELTDINSLYTNIEAVRNEAVAALQTKLGEVDEMSTTDVEGFKSLILKTYEYERNVLQPKVKEAEVYQEGLDDFIKDGGHITTTTYEIYDKGTPGGKRIVEALDEKIGKEIISQGTLGYTYKVVSDPGGNSLLGGDDIVYDMYEGDKKTLGVNQATNAEIDKYIRSLNPDEFTFMGVVGGTAYTNAKLQFSYWDGDRSIIFEAEPNVDRSGKSHGKDFLENVGKDYLGRTGFELGLDRDFKKVEVGTFENPSDLGKYIPSLEGVKIAANKKGTKFTVSNYSYYDRMADEPYKDAKVSLFKSALIDAGYSSEEAKTLYALYMQNTGGVDDVFKVGKKEVKESDIEKIIKSPYQFDRKAQAIGTAINKSKKSGK